MTTLLVTRKQQYTINAAVSGMLACMQCLTVDNRRAHRNVSPLGCLQGARLQPAVQHRRRGHRGGGVLQRC
jgi:hypothetical protein